jgi:two-component system, cell cycle sensor histidine kinase and response regulator CckA
MATQNLKRKKNNNLKDQKRTRASKDPAIITPLSNKQIGNRVEEALQEIEERFRLAFENANIGMCLVDLQGRLTKVNRQMCEIFGYSQEELEGMTVNDIAHPEDLNISTTFIQRATSGEIEYTHFGKRYLHKDGHIVWGAVSSSLVRDPQGVPQYFISHVQDITQRKKAEEALKEGERFLTNIFSSIQDGISILDTELNILRVNPAIEQWYSHAMPLIGKKCYKAYHGRSERCEVCPTYQTINTGKGAYEVVPKTGKGGEIVGWLEVFSFPLIDTSTKKMNGVIEYVRDITGRKRAEEVLRRSEGMAKRMALENAMMAEIGRIISSTLNIEEVYERFAEGVHELIPFEGIAINIINHKEGTVTVPYVSGIAVPGCQPGDIFPLEGSVTGEVARTRSGLIIQAKDTDELKNRFPTFLKAFETGLRSVVAVPLLSKDQVIGAIHFRSTKPNVYSDQNLKLAEDIASQIAGAIANGQLFMEQKHTEEALRSEHDKFRGMLSALGDGVDIVNKNYIIEFQNEFLRERYGDKIGEKCFSAYMGLEKPCGFCSIQEAIRTGQPTRIELVAPDGRNYELNSSPFRDVDGEVKVIELVRDITERKRAEEALRQSEEKYRTILGNIEDGYYEADIAGNFTFFNDAACRMVGYSKDELMGMNNRQYMDQENAKKLYQVSNKVFRTGEPAKGFDWEIIRKDGTKRFIEASISLIKNSSGQPIGYRGVVRDITERKQAEEVLRQSEEKYRTILENIEDAYYEVDLPGNLTFFNDSLCRLVGYSREELMGMNNRQLTDPENAQKLYQEFNKVYRTGRSSKVFDWEIIKKDGMKRNVEASVSLIKDSRAHSIGFRGIVRDITERKRADEALRTEKQRFQTLSEQAPFGMVMIDQDGTFKYMNPQFRELFGYDLTDVPNGETWFRKAYPNPTYRHHVIAQWMKDLESFERGEKIPRIFTATCKDGTKKIVNFISVQLERDEHLMTCEDITERKQAEENLKESEEKYRLLVEESIQGIVIAQGVPPRLVFANPAMTMILGYTFEELSSLSPKEIEALAHPEDRAFFFKNYKDRLEGKSVPPHYELRGIRKDGTVVWLELSSVRIEYKGQPAVQAAFLDITERKQAEESLRKSEERYRTILENIEDGYYEVDIAGNVTFCNDSFGRLFGYSKDEMMGMNNRQYTDEENAQKLYQAFNKVYRTREPTKTFDLAVIRKDGTKLFGEVSVSLMMDTKGQPIGFRGIARDITKRKQAEEALRTEKQRFQALTENSPFGMVMIDQDGTFKYMNPKFRELFGYDLTDVPDGKTWFKKAYPNSTYRHDVIEVWINDIKSFKPGEKRSRIFTVTCKDGTEKTINFIPVQLETGENLMACEDITERKRAEEALKKSEVKFQELFNDAPVGYFEYDVEGRIIDANRTELGMLGYAREEMIGQLVWKFIVEEETARQQILEKLAGTKPPGRGVERTYRRKDGTTLPVLIEDRILRDSGGRIIGIRTTIQDISGLKRAEEEMRVLEEQFRQSQKMEAVGRLGGGIAHDFNNLLTVIKGYSQLSLLDLKESDPLWGNIQEIQKATQRATDLTRQLLAFSRRQILDLKVLDLNTLLRDLDKVLRRIIGEDIELVALLDGNLGRVKIDPGQIEQVIFNLAVNARDAMPSGGKLLIETTNVELDKEYANAHIGVVPGRYVKLSVSDTGIGMSQEVREKVFEPFFTTKDKSKGTGLGLSTVYGIVKQSGGNIWVYSEPGHGTTFKIYLPKVEEELDTLHGRDETEFLPRGSETVLLVEDEQEVRLLAHRLLSQQGYRVLEATNGKEALYVAQEQGGEEIHLLLTDVVMPQMGGKELADQLKIFRPDVKVLYTSGYTDDAIVHHGVLEPGTHFLQKPFSLKTLSHKVREVLDEGVN